MVSITSFARLVMVQSTDVVTPEAGVIVQLEFEPPVALVTVRFVGKS